MMTSENNADRMLTKAVALSLHAVRRFGIYGVLLGIGLAACSYRAPEKSALRTEATTFDPIAMAVARPQAIAEKNLNFDARAASTDPVTDISSVPASGKRDIKEAVASIDRVVGDASVTLSTSTPVAANDVETAASDASLVTMPREERSASASQETWLLAALVILVAAIAGLLRYRRRRADMQAAVQVETLSPQQDAASLEDAVPVTPSSTVVDEPTPVIFPSLEWSYQAPAYEKLEHWDVPSPVDFLPVSLAAYVGRDVEAHGELPVASEREGIGLHEDIETDIASVADPLFSLFDQLEALATRDGDDMPALLIERDSALPTVVRIGSEPLPATMLQAWENLLRQAIPGAETLALPWLLVATLLLRADGANHRDAESFFAEAEQWIELGMASDATQSAAWLAQRMNVDLCRAKRQKAATRLLSLRGMQSNYAQAVAQGEPPVLFAWIDVLTCWAECQFGDAALARYTEAEAICVRLGEFPASADAAQRRRAAILRQRAAIEEGGARLKSLDTAQALLDLLYERAPNADNALAVAVTALARGNVLPPEQAKEAYSHALMHAFMAESEPRLRIDGLQCRLAVQWAYENLPGMPVQSDVAIGLTTRLEALRVQHPETVLRMAQVHLRNADFAHAAALCEKAWRNGQATPALLATWRETCRQWATVSARPDQLAVRQQAMRQLSVASAMR